MNDEKKDILIVDRKDNETVRKVSNTTKHELILTPKTIYDDEIRTQQKEEIKKLIDEMLEYKKPDGSVIVKFGKKHIRMISREKILQILKQKIEEM